MKRWIHGTGLGLMVAVAGCGGRTPATFDAGIDASSSMADASIDAPPGLTSAPSGVEVVSGGGRVTGGTMTMDVQVGHPISQQPATGGTTTVEGGAVIKP